MALRTAVGGEHPQSHPSDAAARNRDAWAIVRCFNEATVVGPVVRELIKWFPNVVGVDDGSTDGSSEVLREAGARVVRHAINLGAGAALQTGLRFSLLDPAAEYFVCFDADGQHRVRDADAMVERLRRDDIDVLIGSRFLGSAAGMPALRRAVLRAGRLFERVSSGVALTDAHNGLRAFTRRFASQVDLQSCDMAYASELLRAIRASGLRYAEHPVTIDYTRYSLAKGQRSVNSINIAVDLCVQRLFGEAVGVNAIKPVLIVCCLGLLAWAFRNRNRVGLRAGIRVGAVLLAAFAVAAITDPAFTTSLAHEVGVGDGADLLLYGLVVTFVCTTMAGYFRSRQLENRLSQVVRAQAITDAVVRDGPPGAARVAEPPVPVPADVAVRDR